MKTTSVITAAVIFERSIVVLEAQRCRRKCHVLLKPGIQNCVMPSMVPHKIEANISNGPVSLMGEGQKEKFA